MNKANLLKGASWFIAVVAVLSLILFLVSGLLKDHLFDLILFVGMLFIISDLLKKYKAEKKKWHIPAIIFFAAVSVLYIVYFFVVSK
ncbi:MAG: hypothetical protein NT150_13610 [Bacteroidetes bacterium]|nr:hypothetical protein [Bacteroidota bacterium]